jgi:peptide subunit release factor 1 (eRF1)
MPRQLSSIFELKKTLAKLENLNRSVDELMSLNIPYGENINKYEQLSKYIIKANSIQAEISRYIKNK